MTIDCGSCGARYNIQDSLIPPQGARVRCKKCAEMIHVPPPGITELAAQDIELIPPTPEAPPAAAPSVPVDDDFEKSTVTISAPSVRTEAPDLGLERYPQEPPPESFQAESAASEPQAPSEEFERAGAPQRFGSPPPFAEASPAPAASYGSTMTADSEETAPSPVGVSPEPVALGDNPSSVSEVVEETAAPEAPAVPAVAPAVESPSTVRAPSGTPLPQGLSPEERSAHEKARRLARVLASDIAIYNRDKKERGIREGNLVAMLGYEIKKSWEIYKERVGSEFANSTPYFRDALNEMLAEGKKIF